MTTQPKSSFTEDEAESNKITRATAESTGPRNHEQNNGLRLGWGATSSSPITSPTAYSAATSQTNG